jgi:DNA-binding HxlR family transcriptional regulator
MKLIKALASTGTIEILMALKKEPLHFGELVKILDYPSPSTSSALATRRLKMLENLGFVHREVKQDRKRRVQYKLTDKGKKIVKIVFEIEEWDKEILRLDPTLNELDKLRHKRW